eukprot:364207-Chlamydomonas_euryale.AAC.13
MDTYNRVAKVVRPKKAALKEAEATLAVVEAALAEKQAALKEVEARLADLDDQLGEATARKEALQAEVRWGGNEGEERGRWGREDGGVGNGSG